MTESAMPMATFGRIVRAVLALALAAVGAWFFITKGRRTIVNEFLQSPSYFEHAGFYNIPDDPDDAGDPARATAVFRSVPHVPPLTWPEFREARVAVEERIAEYARRLDPTVTDSDLRYCVGDELVDRTVEVELPRDAMLTREFVESVQQVVLAPRPLWRVMIHGVSKETMTLVYPNAVLVGTLPADAPLDAALREVVRAVTAVHEARDGPQDRQIAYVQSVLRADPSLPASSEYRVLALCDGYRDDANLLSLWILGAGAWNKRLTATLEHDPDGVMRDHEAEVLADGTMLNTSSSDDDAPYRVIQWIVPRPNSGASVVISRKGTGVIARIQIHADEAISDADIEARLARMAGEGGAPR
jgi:hypothetical protein